MMMLRTHTRRMINPLDPQPEDIHLRDIATALSRMCRFNGHCREFYSVAQHSVRVALDVMPVEHKLCGLLHDATEAYLADMTRPVKVHLPDYKAMEGRFWRAIATKFNLPYELPECVKQSDVRVLAAEFEGQWDDVDDCFDLDDSVLAFGVAQVDSVCWEPKLAAHSFLTAYDLIVNSTSKEKETMCQPRPKT